MSVYQNSESSDQSRYERMIANAALIWNKEEPDPGFDIHLEKTIDSSHYQAVLTVIRKSPTFGRRVLLMSALCDSREKALQDLDYILKDLLKGDDSDLNRAVRDSEENAMQDLDDTLKDLLKGGDSEVGREVCGSEEKAVQDLDDILKDMVKGGDSEVGREAEQ